MTDIFANDVEQDKPENDKFAEFEAIRQEFRKCQDLETLRNVRVSIRGRVGAFLSPGGEFERTAKIIINNLSVYVERRIRGI